MYVQYTKAEVTLDDERAQLCNRSDKLFLGLTLSMPRPAFLASILFPRATRNAEIQHIMDHD